MKKTMNAMKLRGILIFLIVLVIGLSAVGFYFAQGWLRTYAVSVSQFVAESTVSGNDVQSLETLQQELVAQQDIITKVTSIIAPRQNYQNQVIKDLDTYAAKAGIGELDYGFTPDAAAGAAASTSVIVTLESPVSYEKLLRFMSDIESNLPKMQISQINLSRIPGDNTSVRTDQLTIEVSTQ